MKKTYIKPENFVVAINVRDNIMLGGSTGGNQEVLGGGDYTGSEPLTPAAREVIIQDNIQTPDPWDDEW